MHKKLHAVIPRLALLSAFCLFIEVFRIIFARNICFIFLPWNLLLAWVPLWLAMKIKDEAKPLKLFVLICSWLVFFPNAPYLITDFLHLRKHDNFPFWYDVFLLFTFAFNGFMLGIISSLLVFNKMKEQLGVWKAKTFMLLTMLISGYGIYVGRFLRYNSWDVLTDPWQIMAGTLSRILHPLLYPRTYGVTLMAGILLSLTFFIFESLFQAE